MTEVLIVGYEGYHSRVMPAAVARRRIRAAAAVCSVLGLVVGLVVGALLLWRNKPTSS